MHRGEKDIIYRLVVGNYYCVRNARYVIESLIDFHTTIVKRGADFMYNKTAFPRARFVVVFTPRIIVRDD